MNVEPQKTIKPSIIDCDVHPTVEGGLTGVLPYMPEAWAERFKRKRATSSGGVALPVKYLHPNGFIIREDAQPWCGKVAGTDPVFLVADLLEKHKIDGAVLNCLETGTMCAALASCDESVIIASAYNDYFIDRWMPVDKRLKFAITVPSQHPQAAAAEIRRLGKHSQVVAVALPVMNILIGNRYWWPIYEAAQEFDLPILIHGTGADGIYQGGPAFAGGVPDTYTERYVLIPQSAESNVSSLVFSGTLEQFPKLRVIFVEYGFLWMLPLLIRADRIWRELRHEVPWVKKSPIEYIHDQICFTTQPIEGPEDPRDLEKLISMIGYDQLCFSTDYPHWDNDMPGGILRELPKDARQKIFVENAQRTFRL